MGKCKAGKIKCTDLKISQLKRNIGINDITATVSTTLYDNQDSKHGIRPLF